MQALQLWLEQNFFGELLYTALMAMAPVVELRGSIPFGHNVLGLNIWLAAAASIVGNLLPVPFIIIYVRRVFAFLRKKYQSSTAWWTGWCARRRESGRR